MIEWKEMKLKNQRLKNCIKRVQNKTIAVTRIRTWVITATTWGTNHYTITAYVAEEGFDPPTSGLWAQHASAAPLCWWLRIHHSLQILDRFKISWNIPWFWVKSWKTLIKLKLVYYFNFRNECWLELTVKAYSMSNTVWPKIRNESVY